MLGSFLTGLAWVIPGGSFPGRGSGSPPESASAPPRSFCLPGRGSVLPFGVAPLPRLGRPPGRQIKKNNTARGLREKLTQNRHLVQFRDPPPDFPGIGRSVTLRHQIRLLCNFPLQLPRSPTFAPSKLPLGRGVGRLLGGSVGCPLGGQRNPRGT